MDDFALASNGFFHVFLLLHLEENEAVSIERNN